MNDPGVGAVTDGVLIVSGPPGSGKSTVAPLIDARRGSPSACIEADWIWTTITTGFIRPWDPASEHQNQTVLRSMAALTAEMASGGYNVVIEGVVGPWHLPIFVKALDTLGVALSYVVLRPDLTTCLTRAAGRAREVPRVAGHSPLTDSGPIRHLWDQFADLGRYESHVLDTTGLDTDETTEQALRSFADGQLRV